MTYHIGIRLIKGAYRMSNESKARPGMERVAAWIVQQRRLLLVLIAAALAF